LSVLVTTLDNKPVQKITFAPDGTMSFALDDQPVLGMGEGGPKQIGNSWRTDKIELDRRGRLHPMTPWYGTGTYGSYNPVPLMVGTAGWGLFIPTPWGAIDLSDSETGKFIPADPIPPGTVVPEDSSAGDALACHRRSTSLPGSTMCSSLTHRTPQR
jgi:alpha-glucosidase/alpha-D-xyloside xylohydrolase